MIVVNHIRTIFTTDLTIRDLFDHPTIETLARHLDTTTSTRDPVEVPLSSRTEINKIFAEKRRGNEE